MDRTSWVLVLLVVVAVVASAAWVGLTARAETKAVFTLDLREPIREGWLDPAEDVVGLRGDRAPLSWERTLPATDADGDGLYEVEIPFDVPEKGLTLAYKIKVDGADVPDIGWQAGRNHEVLLTRGETVEIKRAWADRPPPMASTVTGRVETIAAVEGEGLAARDVFVYLPPGYAKSDRRYPVLYLHDGQAVFDAAATGHEWRVDETAERLIRAGEIDPLIVVAVANTENRIDEYTPTEQTWRHHLRRAGPPTGSGPHRPLTGPFVTDPSGTGAPDTLRIRARGDTLSAQIPGSDTWQRVVDQGEEGFLVPEAGFTLVFDLSDGAPAASVTATKPPQGGDGNRYGDLLVRRIKPMVDQRFRTRPKAQWTGLGGSSLGGLITLHLGLRHPDVFGRLLVASPSVWWDGRWIVRSVNDLPAPTGQRIWLDVGTGEGNGMVDGARALGAALRKRGWDDDALRYVEADGAEHHERAWAARMPDALRFLFPPVR